MADFEKFHSRLVLLETFLFTMQAKPYSKSTSETPEELVKSVQSFYLLRSNVFVLNLEQISQVVIESS